MQVDPLVGATLGQYRIVELLGRGGMATVYKAHHAALDRFVAIKVLPEFMAHDPAFSERFRREARAVAGLEHPHILPVHDFGEQDQHSYIVMSLVPGGPLTDRMGAPVSLAWALRVCGQIASALDYAHAHGIVHRDVKPSNILLGPDDWAYLADFGIAKLANASRAITRSGVGVGTPEYLSPEQAQGLPLDGRSDLYSLAMTLFELLAGRVPYQADSALAVVLKQLNDPVPSLRAYNPTIPPAIDMIVRKGLAKQRDDRFDTVTEFIAALQRVGGPRVTGGRSSETRAPQETVVAVAAPHPTPARETLVAEVPSSVLAVGVSAGGRAGGRRVRRAIAGGVAAALVALLVVGLRTVGVQSEVAAAGSAPPASATVDTTRVVARATARAEQTAEAARAASAAATVTAEAAATTLAQVIHQELAVALEATAQAQAATATAVAEAATPTPQPSATLPSTSTRGVPSPTGIATRPPTAAPLTAGPPTAQPVAASNGSGDADPRAPLPRLPGATLDPGRAAAPQRVFLEVVSADCRGVVGMVAGGTPIQREPLRDYTIRGFVVFPDGGQRTFWDDVPVMTPRFTLEYPMRLLPRGAYEVVLVASKAGLTNSLPVRTSFTCN